MDAELFSNRTTGPEFSELRKVFDLMSINTLLFARPRSPYMEIIDEITRYDEFSKKNGKIIPGDCETRTFFHDIPVIPKISADDIYRALSKRKSAIVKGKGIVTCGSVTPEQAFISFSSACFSLFVKYFHDALGYFEDCASDKTRPEREFLRKFLKISELASSLDPPRMKKGFLKNDLPKNEKEIIMMLSEAGRAVVNYRLVDSYFGNVSYTHGETVYISQTGSTLDELEECIDAIPLDGSSSAGITASSELSAHRNIFLGTGANAIIHGHPKFSVIMSMHCRERPGCPDNDDCQKKCRKERQVVGTPVVSGEIGTGPTGLVNTVPAALGKSNGVIVYGHGVFTCGQGDFSQPFAKLLKIENDCRKKYFEMIRRSGVNPKGKE